MKTASVQRRIEQGEGQRTEFKESFSEDDEAIRSLAAFAHATGGTVLVGVSDDGRVKGLQLGRNTLESFANKLRRCSQPPLAPVINRHTIGGNSIVEVTIKRAPHHRIHHVFGVALIRVGKTNQPMSPEEQRDRLFEGFKPEVSGNRPKGTQGNESWRAREARREKIYQNNQGLFLVHTWKRSRKRGQIADIVISLRQHGHGPMTDERVKSVEYHLGPKFTTRTTVKSNAAENFQYKVSAYGPMLCLAKVNFDDGSPPLDLERYIDF